MKEYLSLKYRKKVKKRNYDIEWIEFNCNFYDNGFIEIYDDTNNIFFNMNIFDESNTYHMVRNDTYIVYKYSLNKKQKIVSIKYYEVYITKICPDTDNVINIEDGGNLIIKFTNKGWKKFIKFFIKQVENTIKFNNEYDKLNSYNIEYLMNDIKRSETIELRHISGLSYIILRKMYNNFLRIFS